jgi:aspartyl-tRNA(Asn)/glutamyl-tRNA(Gln) amidotransferase subunit A
MSMKLNTLTLKQTLTKLSKKEISLNEVYSDVFEAIEKNNKKLNIFLAIDTEAKTVGLLQKDKPLAGIPIAVKDNFLTTRLPTTASSFVLKGFKSPYESTVTRKIAEAGGVIIGKTNMDAWAHGSSTETSDYGRTINPRNISCLPGGSSGGSSAAVAADMCIVAVGSETAGSIRQPSSWCGTVGLKPTYGRVSRAGVVAMGSSLDSPGPIGKTVEDCAILLEYMVGQDVYDATTSEKPHGAYQKAVHTGVKGMKIGICYIDHPKLAGTEVSGAIEKAGKLFEKFGAIVTPVPLSAQLHDNAILNPDYAVGVYTVVQRGEVSSNLARYDGIRYGKNRSFFGDEAKRRIMLGTFTLSKGYADKYYVRAQQVRSLYINNFKKLFETYDILISPTSPGYALKIGASENSPMFGEIEDMLLEPSSISGLPGINVPCFRDEKTNLYLGMNIVGDQWQEEKIIAAAALYEANTPWNSWVKN